jgi:hypothetical protein
MNRIVLFLFLAALFSGCVKRGSSAIDLGRDYEAVATAGSESWAIWGKLFEGQISSSIIVEKKVSYIGINEQYIIGLRVKPSPPPPHEKDYFINPQPYGYFIIDKDTGEKTLGLTEEEAKKAFADLNMSMSLLRKTSRSYSWRNQ